MTRHLLAEALGTLLLVCTVVGSGIMAAVLAGGNDAVALLGNTIATGAILYVLITILGPVSGAHFNPAVSLVFLCAASLTPACWHFMLWRNASEALLEPRWRTPCLILSFWCWAQRSARAAANGWPRAWRHSGSSQLFWAACATGQTLCPCWSGCILRRAIGLPLRQVLPILP